jgi:hypothetical protein
MVQIKFWYVENNIRIERVETLSRVPCKGENIRFENVHWPMAVCTVIHTPVSETNATVASCFLK